MNPENPSPANTTVGNTLSPNAASVNPVSRQAMTVSDLNRQAKRLLEVSLGQVWVMGELSSLSRPGSGHWYFSLKDDKAQVRCAMFRGFNQRLRFIPKEGDQIIVRAKVSLYEGRGDYQLIVEHIEPAGLGQLQAAFEALKLKLSQEGLFDPAHKKTIPPLNARIVVITSASGAVIHDIISVTKRRFPASEILLLPVTVQGDGAAREIAKAIELANRQQVGDVLIVGRGGGSLEDLWAFNEEVLARAIHASELPVVSAVGHETDVTIADWVADYRAPTPSAAAEKVTPDQYELMQFLDGQQHRLHHFMQVRLKQLNEKVSNLHRHIKHPGDALRDKKIRLGELLKRLHYGIRQQVQNAGHRLESSRLRLDKQHPADTLARRQEQLTYLETQLTRAQTSRLEQAQNRLSLLVQTLNTASPLATLGRGYAIVGSDTQRVLTRADQVSPGEQIQAQLKHGTLYCTVDQSEMPNKTSAPETGH